MPVIVKFTVPGKAFSINAASYRDLRHKTAEYKAWAHNVRQYLTTVPELAAISEAYQMGNVLELDMQIIYPECVFTNAKGQISAKTMDVTNCAKLFVDLLFGDVLNINDRYLVRCTESKAAGSGHYIDCILILR